jgi:tetratricopeptide (TPR) repeat protein
LTIALEHFSLGRAHLLQALKQGTRDFSEAKTYLDEAVYGLRQSGLLDELPSGLLAQAELYRLQRKLEPAQRDLDEAMTIATRGGMRLHEADCHLEYARLYLAMGERYRAKAQENLAKAKAMINEMGYHRRDKDVKELEKQLMQGQ